MTHRVLNLNILPSLLNLLGLFVHAVEELVGVLVVGVVVYLGWGGGHLLVLFAGGWGGVLAVGHDACGHAVGGAEAFSGGEGGGLEGGALGGEAEGVALLRADEGAGCCPGGAGESADG